MGRRLRGMQRVIEICRVCDLPRYPSPSYVAAGPNMRRCPTANGRGCHSLKINTLLYGAESCTGTAG
jgi:hypothetical protein